MRPSVIVAVPENSGVYSGPFDRRRAARRGPSRASFGKKPCRMPRFASPDRLQRDPLILQPDRAADPQPRVFADQLQLLDANHVLIERQLDRPAVPDRVVEQPHLHAVDGAVDEQVVDVGQLADHADRSARHRGRCTATARHEQAHVRIERAVMEPERQLGVGLRGERDAAGAGDRQARRRDVDFAAQLVAAERERPADLPDRFARHRQIVDPELDVVARRLERAAAAGRELDRAGRAQLRVVEGGDVGPPEGGGRRR